MDYWQKRQEAMYKAGEMQVNQYFKRLEKAFNQTKRELQKTIEAFYFRYAEENGLSFAAAQKRLNAEELGELNDFIALAMDNIGKYNQQVNNMSLKARVTRYQALEMQVDAILRQLYAIDYQAESERTMQEVYEDTYYRTWYSIDQYHGFHQAFAQVEPRTVEKLLEYPFNGAAFSSRIWKQKDHLQTQLTEAVTTMLIQGKHPSTLTKEFAKKMNSKKFDAYRLLHTESSFLMSEATHAGYKEDGVPKYEILATLDSKTCNVCGDLDNKVYEVGKEVTGVNMPPFHPLCRCTTVPHYDDTPTAGLTRAARDPETGKTYEVPADMSYTEWRKKYVDKQEENQKRYADRREERKQQYAKRQEEKNERLAEYSLFPENRKRYENKAAIWEKKVRNKYTVSDEIKQHRDDTPIRMVELVDKYASDEFVVIDEISEHAFAYDPDTDTIRINTAHPQYSYQDYKEVMLHELAHRIDQNEFGSPMNAEFSNAIIETEKYLMENAERYRKMFEPGGELEYNNLISDIMGCITDNLIVGGASHDSQYIGVPGYTELEIFADIFSALYQGDDDTVNFIKAEFSDIHKAFLRILGG